VNRRDLLRLAGLAGLTAPLAACGIDGDSKVVVDGLAPTAGSGVSQDNLNGPRKRREVPPGNEQDFVNAFLDCPAGTYPDTLGRVRDFMTTEAVRSWKPTSNINVVRLLKKPVINEITQSDGTGWVAVLSVLHVGVLTPEYRLDGPTADRADYTFEFAKGVEPKNADGYFVTRPPDDIIMTEDALRFYAERNLYFWNSAYTSLVPDRRYIPYTVDPVQHRDKVVDLLMGGPAPWLTRAVNPLPAHIKPIGKVVTKDDALVINLTSEARGVADLGKLSSQLSWTLRQELSGEASRLEIQIESEPKRSNRDFLPDNLGYRKVRSPELFAVQDGRVVRLDDAGAVPLLRPEDNKLIETASITADHRAVAAVRHEGSLRRLYLGQKPGDGYAPLAKTDLTSGGPMSRPLWLGSETVLIAARGGLYQVWRDGTANRVSVPRAEGSVTWAAIGLDARRIALVVSGRLFVAALDWYGAGPVTLGEARAIPSALRDLSSVVFSHEDRLVLSGLAGDGSTAVAEISIDGSGEDRRVLPANFGQATIEGLSAYQLSPTEQERVQPLVVFAKSQRSWQLSPVEVLHATHATPTASPSTGTKTSTILTNPFYAA
jgi:hypothetical protein